MNIRIDDQEVEVFGGALVKDVLLKHSQEKYRDVLSGHSAVVDERGNPVGSDGELSDGDILYVKKR